MMNQRDREHEVEALAIRLELTGVTDTERPPRAEAAPCAGDVRGAEIDTRVGDAVGESAEQLPRPAADVQDAITVIGAHILSATIRRARSPPTRSDHSS